MDLLQVRKKTEPLRRIIVTPFAKTGISPNSFSALAMLWAGLFALCANIDYEWPALIFLFLFAIWDGIDGSLARLQNRATVFGEYIEGIIDKWAEIIVLFGFLLLGYSIESFLVAVLMVMIGFTKTRTSLHVHAGEFDWPSMGSRHVRMTLFVGIYFLSILISDIHIDSLTIDTTSVGLLFVAFLTGIGNMQRLLLAKKIIAAGGTNQLGIEERHDV